MSKALGVHKLSVHAVQGHVRVAAVLDAARLAGAHWLAAALPARLTTECGGPGAEPGLQLADSSVSSWPPTTAPNLEECSLAWAAGVLARRGAASAGAGGARRGGWAPAPACKPSFPRTDAWASEAWPGLADVVVTLVLRSASAR